MLCLPIPGTEVAGDPKRLVLFDDRAGVTVLSGSPPRAEVSFGGPGETGICGGGPWLEPAGVGEGFFERQFADESLKIRIKSIY